MKKRTWKLRTLPEAAEVVRSSPSLRKAAERLGVHVSTLSRAIREGRLQGPGGRQQTPASAASTEPTTTTFLEWARSTYALSRVEDELCVLAQQALDLARDPASKPPLRLQAMAQFRGIVRELRLPVEEEHGHVETQGRRFPRPA